MILSYYLDSSALVKRYVAESGSVWVADLMHRAQGNRIYLAEIAGAEVVAALARRAAFGGSTRTFSIAAIAAFRLDFSSRFRLVETSQSLIASAMNLAEQHSLRGYDSVQLAAMLQVNAEYAAVGRYCTLVSADVELNAAAVLEGITVENPNDHP